jgi:glucose/arabinose dehydrogenase
MTRVYQTADYEFSVDTLASGLKTVFGMDWLPDGRLLFTERARTQNSISLLDPATQRITTICNVPIPYSDGDGGMLDILLHPDYAQNGWIYFAYSAIRSDSLSTLVVERARLRDTCFEERETIFIVKPWFRSNGHFGCRMQIRDGFLFLAMGDRYEARDSAQTLTNHLGKLIRVHDDGRVPADNPFVNHGPALPEIWSYGHRNPQGLAFHPVTAGLWIHEHGPQGGDELNLVLPGKNYGWPVITFGEEYGGGKIGAGITEKEGMEQPVYTYVPSIAPGGMMFYSGDVFKKWKNNIFIGALALQHINRLVLEDNKVVTEERILEGNRWRIRSVKQGPDGLIYFAVDNGMILRLKPASP